MRKTWIDALSHCRNTGGDLVSVANKDEEEQIVKLLKENDVVWIGLRKKQREANFVWSDGSSMSYQNWGKGEPSYDWRASDLCVELVKNMEKIGWNDLDCDAHDSNYQKIKRKFVCRSKGNVTR